VAARPGKPVPAYHAPPTIANPRAATALPPAETPPAETAPAEAPAPSSAASVTAAISGTGGVSRAFFSLVKGGFRAISGAIGKVNHGEYQISTPVATIGIRGTDYISVICDALCAYDPVVSEITPANTSAEGGVITGVTEGSIVVTSPQGESVLTAGHYLLVLGNGLQIPLPGAPRFIAVDPIPNPAQCK
jgi:hypothetical protein